jgi:hypothetical protein
VQDNFRSVTVLGNRSFDTERATKRNHPDLRFVALPNGGGERLIGVRFVEIDESWRSLRFCSRPRLPKLLLNWQMAITRLDSKVAP